MNKDIFVSLQRWIYASGSTVQDALRNLADAIDSFDLMEQDTEHREYLMFEYTQSVEVSYDAEEELPCRAGICMSWRPAHD